MHAGENQIDDRVRRMIMLKGEGEETDTDTEINWSSASYAAR